MEFDKTRCSCPGNSDQNYTQHSSRGGDSGDVGSGGGEDGRGSRVGARRYIFMCNSGCQVVL